MNSPFVKMGTPNTKISVNPRPGPRRSNGGSGTSTGAGYAGTAGAERSGYADAASRLAEPKERTRFAATARRCATATRGTIC